jgi:uncharacterized protein
MQMSEHVATVQSLYAAFGRGDVPAILEQLSDDVRWDDWATEDAPSAGVPWLHARVGKEGAREFFSLLGGFEFHEFQVRSLMAGGNQVVADVVVDLTVTNGVRFRDEEMHLFTFDEAGKVTRFRHYVDTAKHIAAARG